MKHVTYTCDHCGDPFSALSAKSKYCSAQCRRKADYQRRKESGETARIAALVRDTRTSNKARMIEYLGGACQHCSIDNPVVLQFHHPEGVVKSMPPSKLLTKDWNVLFPELSQCELLCANCHLIEHLECSHE